MLCFIDFEQNWAGGGSTRASFKIRGPDPDGDRFVVQIENGGEIAINETFVAEADAQAEADRLKEQKQLRGSNSTNLSRATGVSQAPL